MCNNPNFRPKPIAEFFDGHHHFFIPSYQRGYRWENKQVKDLLKDICDFAENAVKKSSNAYYLQPIVVKEKNWEKDGKCYNGWEVIDGQQRLTTLFLLCKYLQKDAGDKDIRDAQLFTLHYETRSIDYSNIDEKNDIDSFHINQAENIIQNWFDERECSRSSTKKVLFSKVSMEVKSDSEIPQVKFIWYVADNDDDIETIKIFNNLNKGKIRLTNAELIKALFVLKSTEKNKDNEKTELLDIKELAYEWNEMENQLHNDSFWYFLSNKSYNPATRIDIIFDFLTLKRDNENEEDFSYRKFQKLYDGLPDNLWKEIPNFTQAWNKVKEVYQTFIYWYEDNVIYHYIGYLINKKMSIQDIYKRCKEKHKTEVVIELRSMIAQTIIKKIKKADEIDELTYSDKDNVRDILILFNVETCVKQINSEYRFSFAKYKNNSWDIEHVDSQKENPLTKIKDKIIWLNYLKNLHSNDKNWNNLQKRGLELSEELQVKKKDEGEKFKDIYNEVLVLFNKENEVENGSDENSKNIKDTIGNLTLLDSGTNRGYGNALFPSKRQEVINREQAGIFIPVCTKNLFLKYYSKHDTGTSQWKRNTWTEDDAKSYLQAIHETIDWIFN